MDFPCLWEEGLRSLPFSLNSMSSHRDLELAPIHNGLVCGQGIPSFPQTCYKPWTRQPLSRGSMVALMRIVVYSGAVDLPIEVLPLRVNKLASI